MPRRSAGNQSARSKHKHKAMTIVSHGRMEKAQTCWPHAGCSHNRNMQGNNHKGHNHKHTGKKHTSATLSASKQVRTPGLSVGELEAHSFVHPNAKVCAQRAMVATSGPSTVAGGETSHASTHPTVLATIQAYTHESGLPKEVRKATQRKTFSMALFATPHPLHGICRPQMGHASTPCRHTIRCSTTIPGISRSAAKHKQTSSAASKQARNLSTGSTCPSNKLMLQPTGRSFYTPVVQRRTAETS